MGRLFWFQNGNFNTSTTWIHAYHRFKGHLLLITVKLLEKGQGSRKTEAMGANICLIDFLW